MVKKYDNIPIGRDFMKAFVKELHTINKEYPFEEKVIIVDQYSIGEQIIETYIKKGFQAINLKYKTVFDLALEVIEVQTNEAFNIIDETIGSQLTYLVLTYLKEEGLLMYFHRMEITASFSRSIYKMIHSLRMAGHTSQTLRPNLFLTEKKGQDIIGIFSRFEELLQVNNMIDSADVFRRAIQSAQKDDKVFYILQSNLSLSHLEEMFLQKIVSETAPKLPLQKVFGINLSEQSSLQSIIWGEPTSLSYLYDLDRAIEPGNLSLLTAKTEEIEIKNILQKIKTNDTPLDEQIVYYTNGDKYITLFYHLSQKGDIPITFGEGIPILLSRPGRLAVGMIKWMKSNYSVSVFLDLLHEGLLDLGEEAPSHTSLTRLLRDASIGWSKERYISQLNGMIQSLSERKKTVEDEELISYYDRKIQHLSWLLKWFKMLWKRLPNNEEQMNYRETLVGMTYMIKHYSKSISSLDEVAKESLLNEMEKVMPFANDHYERYHIFEKLEDLLLSIRVLQSGPKPGSLHVASYQSGLYHSRNHIYIVGLDNRKFPGGSNEDPLLLDRERKNLGNGLPFMQESGKNKLYQMLQLLAQSEGHVTVSYCHFDVNENRDVSPSHLFLQCYRMKTGNKNAEFDDVRRLPSGLVANDVFDERDYWGAKLVEENPLKIGNDLFHHFSNLSHGMTSERKRNDLHFTEYDGLVDVDQEMFDPRKNEDRMMTAGKLEMLAACPYSYFLSEILGVKPIETMEYDPYRWLDPATRGSVLHEIFELYDKNLLKETEPQSLTEQEELINQIAVEVVNRQKEILPPPNERDLSNGG